MSLPRLQPKRGATTIEFALVVLIFFIIMLGMLEFARAYYVRNTTQHLTRCMAREMVVRAPSDYLIAKQGCLVASGGRFFWPFFQLKADDMTGLFQASYCFRDDPAHCVTEPDPGRLDDQVARCQEGNTECVATVMACLQENYLLQEFGILRPFLPTPPAADRQIIEPAACTTMPAESMGLGRS